jgi:drug/metabolite transporter (DMT)-like permease
LLTKKYSGLLFTANTIGIVSIILALTMYTELWVVATSLISLLYLLFVYLFGYLILKEIPKKKDIIIALLVAACIFIWMLFKN